MSDKFLNPLQTIKEGFLTADEVQQLQKIANKYNTIFYVVGSRARGMGRNISRTHPNTGAGLVARAICLARPVPDGYLI